MGIFGNFIKAIKNKVAGKKPKVEELSKKTAKKKAEKVAKDKGKNTMAS